MKMEDAMSDKPREFWIELGGDPSDDKEIYKRYCAAVPFKPTNFSDEVIHVIEHSAYQSLLELNKELVELLKQHHQWHLDFTEVPKEFVGLNMAAEYCDSIMCDETMEALAKARAHMEGK